MHLLLLYIGKVINKLFGRYKSRVNYYRAWKYLHTISLQGLGRQLGNNTKSSGEEKILENLFSNQQKKFTVIDVGANKGQYSSLVLSKLKDEQELDLHIFEPSPVNIDFLHTFFTDKQNPAINFSINEAALSDFNGELDFFSDREGSDLSSTFNLRVSVRPFDTSQTIKVAATTLDTYAAVNKIDRIDLFKLDVEGSEFNALKGASSLINNGKISKIQFEFGTGNISSRIFFLDFWEMLSPNYKIYHVQKDGLVEIRNYDTEMEIFKTTNYFAVLK